MDINEDRIITFKEKSQKMPKRKLSKMLFQKIKYLISINKLKETDYLFFNNYKNKLVEQRANYMNLKLNRIIKQSSCFSKAEGEVICAHMFLATHL